MIEKYRIVNNGEINILNRSRAIFLTERNNIRQIQPIWSDSQFIQNFRESFIALIYSWHIFGESILKAKINTKVSIQKD